MQLLKYTHKLCIERGKNVQSGNAWPWPVTLRKLCLLVPITLTGGSGYAEGILARDGEGSGHMTTERMGGRVEVLMGKR